MKKFLLTTTATAAALFAGQAMAVDLDAVPQTFDVYASERLVAPVVISGATVEGKIGFGVSDQQERFLRYTLTNGTFAQAVAGGDVSLTPVPPSVSTVTAAISQGGAVGDSYVILQITAGGDIDQKDILEFVVQKLSVTNKSANVGVEYKLYEGAANAQAGGAAGLLYAKSGTLVGIASGLTFGTTKFTTTASVAVEYKEFTPTAAFDPVDGYVDVGIAKLGAASLDVTPNVLDENGFALAFAQIVATTDLSVAGDLSAATAVHASVDDCTTLGAPFVINATKTGATLTAFAGPFTQSVCFVTAPANTVAIAAETYQISADVTPAVGTDTTDRGPLVLGQIVRDGTVLKHAFAESAAAGTGYSAAVHMTNLGSSLAPYTVRCMLNNGSAAGTPGTIAANSAVRQSLAGGMGCGQTNLRGIEVTFAVPEGRVIGAIVRQNTTTGTASFDTMIGSK